MKNRFLKAPTTPSLEAHSGNADSGSSPNRAEKRHSKVKVRTPAGFLGHGWHRHVTAILDEAHREYLGFEKQFHGAIAACNKPTPNSDNFQFKPHKTEEKPIIDQEVEPCPPADFDKVQQAIKDCKDMYRTIHEVPKFWSDFRKTETGRTHAAFCGRVESNFKKSKSIYSKWMMDKSKALEAWLFKSR